MTDSYNRRTFITAAGAAAGTTLAGCTRGGGGGGTSTSGGNSSSGGSSSQELAIPLSKYDADIDWKQFEGSKINIGAVQHPWVEAIKPAVPVFEQLTGIDVV